MFESRTQAGRMLADKLIKRQTTGDVVLGIPRGGVVVAKTVAEVLGIPLDVLVVKKLGAPGNPELAIGALTLDDVTYIDHELARTVGADTAFLNQEVLTKHRELLEREKKLRRNKGPLEVTQKKVILVDDGIATGATVFAAIEWLRKHQSDRIILAIPVVAKDTAAKLRKLVDDCVFMDEPTYFGAVGQFYQIFSQVTDEEVVNILRTQNVK